MLSSPFSATKSDLERLDQKSAIEFIANLLWAESRRISIPVTSITISYDVNVPDGGIDAQVEGGPKYRGELITSKLSCFQVKSGKNFLPQEKNQIKKELFGSGKGIEKENLGERVKYCLDKRGTYVLVCLHKLLNPKQIGKTEANLREYFRSCGYNNVSVMIVDQLKLIGLLKRYPSLTLALKGININFQTHFTWSNTEQMRKEYIPGKRHTADTIRLRERLRDPADSVHIRILGEPGIGKTKFSCEATNADDLSPLVIYCDSATKFLSSNFLDYLTMQDNNFFAILVIDECDYDKSSYIWNRLKSLGSRIKLITIYNETELTSGTTDYLELSLLGDDQTTHIISSYGIAKEQARKYARLCSGSPGVAHVIGFNLMKNPEDLLRSPDTVNFWDRYIVARDDPGSPDVKDRRRVLKYLSLFKRFGFSDRYTSEAISIASLIERNFNSITWARFQEIIASLRERKILQGDVTLYITPKALHVKLWNEFWETHGTGFNLTDLRNSISPELNNWFDEMLVYAGSSEASSKTAEKIIYEMHSSGPKFITSKSGARLFLALSEGVPMLALEYLKTVLQSWSHKDLLNFKEGRREVIFGLEKIVVWPELFEDGIRLLLTLADAENETWANNATGVFSELFLPISKTGANPKTRLKILQDILSSSSNNMRLLGLQAAKKSLQYGQISLFNAENLQGLKGEVIWKPSSVDDLVDYQLQVWGMLCKASDEVTEDERHEISNILLHQSFGLSTLPRLDTAVFDCISSMKGKPYVDQRELVTAVMKIVRHKSRIMSPELSLLWKNLNNELEGVDLVSKLKRYVGMNILQDHIESLESKVSDLARELSENRDVLEKELIWLTTEKAENGYRLGYELGKVDKSFSLYPKILEIQKTNPDNKNMGLLGGYLSAMYELDLVRRDNEIEKLADSEFCRNVPCLCSLSGLTDKTGLLVLDTIKNGLDVIEFRYFLSGGVIRHLSSDILILWVDYLMQSAQNYAAWTAMDLYYAYFRIIGVQQLLPKEQALRLLLHRSFFSPKQEGNQSIRVPEFAWTEIAKAFVSSYPKESISILDLILEHFGDKNSIVFPNSSAISVAMEITRRYPNESWTRIVKYLGPPTTTHSFWIEDWLKGDDYFKDLGALALVPAQIIWSWVDDNPKVRAPYLASFIPKSPFSLIGKVCPRELLARYGSNEEVGRQLMMNLDTGMVSETPEEKKKRYIDLKSKEDNSLVKKWIDEYVGLTDRFGKMLKRLDEREFPEQSEPEIL